MTAPFATVVLPTFDRAATLPFAVASVLAQEEGAIELLIVLDGATEACRAVARATARADARVRVLDWPKAPAHGERNVGRAVAEATSERIFYVDDDDLFLPRHVAVLGALLDRADVVDSRLCSADRHGRLHLGVASPSSPPIRRMLGEYRLKMLYDTHFAHRKSAYGRFSTWVPPVGEGSRPVWSFFAGFAGDPACRWASTEEVTAVSLHGAARRDMTQAARASEIAGWSARLRSPASRAEALASAGSTFNLFRLLLTDAPDTESLELYLEARGGYASGTGGELERALFGLFHGVAPGDDDLVVALVERLSEPVESDYRFHPLAALVLRVYGPGRAEALLRQAAEREGENQGARLAAYSAVLALRDLPSALRVADRAVAQGPDPLGSLAAWRATLQSRAAADPSLAASATTAQGAS